jgi:hypothetical protein
MKTAILATAIAVATITTQAMTVREALGMIESGNNDYARGKAGEVSRYQIKPAVWEYFSKSKDYDNEPEAWQVAFQIIETRAAGFKATHHRAPNAFEIYVLWNAPREIEHPSPAVSDRATRFANLINRK